MKKQFVFLFLLSVLISACAIFKGGKKEVTDISIEYDKTKAINYGYKLPIKIIANYSNGKQKDVTSKDELTVKIKGAKYTRGAIYCYSNPSSFQSDTIFLDATYQKDDKTFTKSLVLPFNYKGSLNFKYNGASGDKGETGRKGSTSLIFRNGKAGGAGLAGYDGAVGHDLTVFIWKEVTLYYIKIYDMTADKTYYYKANDNTTSYSFNVNGGQGGQGGDGGEGGDGKDGKATEKKTKLPGNGGDGGIGGPGGNGGKGGNIYIFIHPNAAAFQNKITTNNNGGAAGSGGNGGKGGKAGTPLEGQSAKSAGYNGAKGINGLTGANGDVINIEIQQFDTEDAKNN